MSSKQKLLLLILALIILDLIIWIATQPPVFYNKVELTSDNIIKNETKMAYIDTVILVGLEKESITGVSVIVKSLTKDISDKFQSENGLDLQATIIGNENQFVLYVNDMGRKECILPLSHELIHLHQYHTGELQILTPKQIKWKGVELDQNIILSIPYKEREWEKVAFEMETPLSKLIEKELY